MQSSNLKSLPTILGFALFSTLAFGEQPPEGKSTSQQVMAESEHRPERWMLAAPGVYTGGEPRGADCFNYLAKLGVRVVVSVDGLRPDVAAARRAGLRYVHIPIGYDGITKHASASLAQVMAETKGSVYIHCHHGRHRGPAAAAIAASAAGRLNRDDALRVLRRAGTSQDYAGLWRAVKNYTPSDSGPAPKLVEVAEVASITAAMANIDRPFGVLRNWSRAERGTRRPELGVEQQALLLKEGLRETLRIHGDQYEEPFQLELREALRMASDLQSQLKAKQYKRAAGQVARLKSSCAKCHRQHRDGS